MKPRRTPVEARLREYAHELGFSLVGVASATEADGFARFREWLDRDYAGEMSYLHRHAEARRHPSAVLADVRSVVMLAMNDPGSHEREHDDTGDSSPSPALVGRVARYAQGPDYHDVIREKLNRLADWLREAIPDCSARGVVDTAPLLERDFARRAGLGWFGKNTMLINKRLGSFLFLASLLTSAELVPDTPHEASHCGSCTACLDACPTDAFTGPGWLDARRCISYLTIERKTDIPEHQREGISNWLFGCDVCQDVCPWNRRQPLDVVPTLPHRDDLESLNLIELLEMDEATFRARFRGTALMRSKRRGLLRNAALILGNIGDERAIPALNSATTDPEPLIAEAARWALDRIKSRPI